MMQLGLVPLSSISMMMDMIMFPASNSISGQIAEHAFEETLAYTCPVCWKAATGI